MVGFFTHWLRFGVVTFLVSALWGASAQGIDGTIAKAPQGIWTLSISSQEGKPYLNLLDSPPRLVIDYPPQAIAPSFLKYSFDKTPIVRLRHSLNEKRRRLVFDLRNSLEKPQWNYQRLGDSGLLSVSLIPKSSTPIKPPKAIKGRESLSLNKDFVVVIDPGHGGKDPGAIGRLNGKRYAEKDIVLAFSKAIVKAINAKKGFRAHLTRSSDQFLPLRSRIRNIRNQNPQLFISVHANAFTSPKVRGTAPFILSLRGADSETSRWLSHKENNELLGEEAVDLKELDGDIQGLLLNLSTQATILASQDLGQMMLDEFKQKNIKLLHNHVEKAAFVVLKSLDIPSILLEIGFMSSPLDLDLMRKSSYRTMYAKAVADSIERFAQKRRATLD